MIELDEPAFNAKEDVLPRDDADPKLVGFYWHTLDAPSCWNVAFSAYSPDCHFPIMPFHRTWPGFDRVLIRRDASLATTLRDYLFFPFIVVENVVCEVIINEFCESTPIQLDS